MFEEYTQKRVLNNMLSRMNVDTREGSVAHDLTSPAAIELAMAYIALDSSLDQAFADTAIGTELERITRERGIERTPAQFATGRVTLTHENERQVPANTRVTTVDDLGYLTQETVTIENGAVVVDVIAEEPGTLYNVDAGEIINIDVDEVGVTNDESMTGGIDRQTDEELREEYFTDVRQPSASGNIGDYERWALEVDGVTNVKVNPLANGPGTVEVIVLGQNGRTPEQTVLDDASAHIDDNRPVVADVSVLPAPEVPLTIEGTVVMDGSRASNDIEADITEGIKAHLESIAFDTDVVRYNAITDVIYGVAGVLDYSNITINSGTSNVSLNTTDVAFLDTLNLTYTT